ncbi:MAG: hypothetical protein RIC88_11725 [Ekhidna sp.]
MKDISFDGAMKLHISISKMRDLLVIIQEINFACGVMVDKRFGASAN